MSLYSIAGFNKIRPETEAVLERIVGLILPLMGDTRPKAPNQDRNGVRIPANEAANRRVVMRLYRPLD